MLRILDILIINVTQTSQTPQTETLGPIGHRSGLNKPITDSRPHVGIQANARPTLGQYITIATIRIRIIDTASLCHAGVHAAGDPGLSHQEQDHGNHRL